MANDRAHLKTEKSATPATVNFGQLNFLQQMIALLFMPFVEKSNTSNETENSLFSSILGFNDTAAYKDWHQKMAQSGWNSWKEATNFGHTNFHRAREYISHSASSIANMAPPKNVLDLVAKYESHGDYNILYGGSRVQPPKKITEMTINEVLAWQHDSVRHGSISSAAGRYQIIDKTLETLTAGIDRNQKFDEKMQDQLATKLLEQRGYNAYLNGKMSSEQFMHNLSQEWASIPSNMSGLSFYENVAGNHAGHNAGAFVAALDGLRTPSHAATLPGGINAPSSQSAFAQVASADQHHAQPGSAPKNKHAPAPGAPVVA